MATKKASTKKGGAKKGGAKKAGAKKGGAKAASGKKLSLGGLIGGINPCHLKCIRAFITCIRQPGANKEQCALRLARCIVNCK